MHPLPQPFAPFLFGLCSMGLLGCDIPASTTTATKMEDGGRAGRSGSCTWTQRVEFHCIAAHVGGHVATEVRS